MKFRKITKVLAAALTIGILATGCGSTGSSSAADTAASGSSARKADSALACERRLRTLNIDRLAFTTGSLS